MSSGAIIVHRQNKYIRGFRQAAADSPAGARTLAEVDLPPSWIFDRMASQGVFVSVDGDRWYLDDAQADRFVRRRRNKIVGFLVAAGVVIFLLFVFRAV